MRASSVNECWISPISLEWSKLKPRSWYSSRMAGRSWLNACWMSAPVVLEPPHPVGRGGEDHEADEPLHREHAQDQLVAQFPAPAEQRRRRGRAAAVLDLSVAGPFRAGRGSRTCRSAGSARPFRPRSVPSAGPAAPVRPARTSRVPYGHSRTGSSPQPLLSPFPALPERRRGAQIHCISAGPRGALRRWGKEMDKQK